MDEGAVLPDRHEPVQAEMVRETTHSRVTRLFAAGRAIIRKEFTGPAAPRRLRHELGMLERLRGVVGAAQLLDEPRYPGSITLADAGQTSLSETLKPLAPEDLIRVATALAEAVAAMHAGGVMHRDICPANIVISSDGVPRLVGFGLATSLAEIRPEFTHHSQIVGTLAYLAPEQTGRTGRPVDQRADLYALGATLYELATGAPPFGVGDPLRLTHDHLARVPAAPAPSIRLCRKSFRKSSCICWKRSPMTATSPPAAWCTTCGSCVTAMRRCPCRASARGICRCGCCRRRG